MIQEQISVVSFRLLGVRHWRRREQIFVESRDNVSKSPGWFKNLYTAMNHNWRLVLRS